MSKAKEILEKLKDKVFMTEKGLVSLAPIIGEAIAELEALQQPKSCAKCKAFKLDDEYNDGFGQCFWGIHFPNGNSLSYHKGTDFYCSEFKAKEQ